jgi:SpoVK/Ycf46/Vps4 family AAA+-type ATPase
MKSRYSSKDSEDSGPSPRISLSIVLNVIDGIAAGNSRIVIMTANRPDKLDEALTRESRIHMRILFTPATKEQTREMFMRFYTSGEMEDNTQDENKTHEDTEELLLPLALDLCQVRLRNSVNYTLEQLNRLSEIENFNASSSSEARKFREI